MRKWLAVGVVSMLAGATAGQDRERRRDTQEEFTGAWRLAWLERQVADGTPRRVDCTGMFVFTRDGHASVQVMEPNPQAQAGPDRYSQGGYEASWGTYTVDERTHTFTFHVEGALVRTLIGKDLPRAYEISGGQLTVTPVRADEHWKVAWKRY